MVQLAAWIFRDFVTDGVPSSGAHPPKKAEIREWGTYVEALYAAVQAGGGVVFQTKASMTLGYAANQIAWVVADATAANNGIYQKQGASGSGSWLKVAELPYSVIYAQNDNSGTANAVKATASVPVSTAAYSQLITVPFTVANTGAMTLSINNETPRPLVTNTGQVIPAGYMQPGMAAFVQIDGAGKYRLFSYGDASAIQAIVESLLLQAQAAAQAAIDAASSVIPNVFATKAVAAAYSPVVAPDFISIAGYAAAGDGGGALYKKVASQPSHAGKFSITLQSAAVVWYEIAESLIDAAMLGAPYGGLSDCRAAFATADAVAVAQSKGVRISGLMKISSAITVASKLVFTPSGTIKPDSNIVVTLGDRVEAGGWQIFDRSAGGGVHFSKGAGEVWVEWWGARAEPGGRTDNQIPIQHAIDACGSVISPGNMGVAPNPDGNGGVVRFASSAPYKVSGRIHLRNRTILRGNGGYSPELQLNNATWNGDSEMVLSQNGTQSQFWCRLEDMVINSNGLSTMNRVIYSPSWQESCGLRDVLIRNFYNTALQMDGFLGGSVGIVLRGVQFFPWATPGGFCKAIDIFSDATVARHHIILEEVSFAGITYAAPPGINLVGIRANGRMDLECRGVFVEGYDIGVLLKNGASLTGNFRGPGNPSVQDLIETDTDFTGRIDCLVSKGSAVKLLNSFTGGQNRIYQNVEPIGRRIVYPHTPTQVLASGRLSNGLSTPTLSNGQGVSTVSKSSTGIYKLNFDTNVFAPNAGTEYRVRAFVESVTGATWYVNAANFAYVEIAFKNLSGTLADVGDFDFEIYARPGT